MSCLLYHYHAMWQRSDGNMAHVDGTLEWSADTLPGDFYTQVRTHLAQAYPDAPRNFTVCSLTCLGSRGTEPAAAA